jgi:hypothetical protein
MLAILVTAVALFIFGAIWYTFLFGKMWSNLNGFTKMGEDPNKPSMAKSMAFNFLLQVVTAWVMYYVYLQVIALSYAEFIKILVIIWLGFSLPIYVNQTLWERKSWKLLVLNSASGILGAIIGAALIFHFA